MEPQNPNQPSNPTLPPIPPVQDPTQSQQPVRKLTPKESIKLRIGEIKHALKMDDPQKVRKMIIMIVAAALILIVLVVAYSFIPKQVAQPLPTLTPIPESTSQPVENPSPYVSDPELLRIMDSLQELDAKTEQTTLREDDLRLPSVDWDVSF